MAGAGLHPAPVLETERLVLRGFAAGDFDAYAAIMAKPDVIRFLGAMAGAEELWRRIVSMVGMWTVLGYGGWIVERKADGRVLGNTGFFDARRGIGWDGQPEMGWILDSDVHGTGIAHEACSAALRWADANLEAPAIWAMISTGNVASLKLAERLGFERSGTVEYKDETLERLCRTVGR